MVVNNHAIHTYLVEGVPVESQRPDGTVGGALVRVLAHDNPENNEFLAVNQFTVVEDNHERRADIVLFVNGLPLAVVELKNAADQNADVWKAFNQLQTYKHQILSLFTFNEALLISDGVQARMGTLTAGREWFTPWRTIEGEHLADASPPQLQVVLEGVFQKRRFLDLIRYFTVFEDDGGGVLLKKVAGYHQYRAVNAALAETLRASLLPSEHVAIREGDGTYFAKGRRDARPGDQRVWVIWHTQGSGKSLTMAFYAGRVVWHPAMQNPTIVVIADRKRPGRPAFRHLRAMPRAAAPAACQGPEQGGAAGSAPHVVRRGRLHHGAQVLPIRG